VPLRPISTHYQEFAMHYDVELCRAPIIRNRPRSKLVCKLSNLRSLRLRHPPPHQKFFRLAESE